MLVVAKKAVAQNQEELNWSIGVDAEAWVISYLYLIGVEDHQFDLSAFLQAMSARLLHSQQSISNIL